MIVLNLFFIPVVAVYLWYRLERKEITFTASLLFHWVLSCVAVSVATKVIVAIVKYLFSIEYIALDSSYYSLFAIFASVLVVLLAKLFRFRLPGEKNEKE